MEKIVIKDQETWLENTTMNFCLERAAEYEARNDNSIKSLMAPQTEEVLGVKIVTDGMSEAEVEKELKRAEIIWNNLCEASETHTWAKTTKNGTPWIETGKIGDIWMSASAINSALKSIMIPIKVNYTALWIIIRAYKVKQYKEMFLKNEQVEQAYKTLVQKNKQEIKETNELKSKLEKALAEEGLL